MSFPKNIVFYCNFNNGDIFFSQRFIHNIIDNNPTITFYYYCKCSSFIYNELNISHYNGDTNCFHINDWNPYFKLNDDTLAINYWILGWKKYYDLPFSPDTFLQIYNEILVKLFNDINQTFALNLVYKSMDYLDLIPKIPQTDISAFINWSLENKGKKLFYYNYLGQSGQIMPIHSMHEHDNIIISLADKHRDICFIIAKSTERLLNEAFNNGRENIILCDYMFDYFEDPKGENLSKFARIAAHCDWTITYDIGACMYYFNFENLTNDRNKRFVLSPSDRYVKNVIDITTQIGIPNFVIYIRCCNVDDIIREINVIVN